MPTPTHPQTQKKTGLSRITHVIATRINSITGTLRSKFTASSPPAPSSEPPLPTQPQPRQIPVHVAGQHHVHVAGERTSPPRTHLATPREPALPVPDTADIVKRWQGAQTSAIKSMSALQDKQLTFLKIVDGEKGRSPGRHAGKTEAGIAREQLVAAREGLAKALSALRLIDAERRQHQINEPLVIKEHGGEFTTTSMPEMSLVLHADGASRVKAVDELLASLPAGHPRSPQHGMPVESSAPRKRVDLKRLEKEGLDNWREVKAAIEMVDAACKQRPHFLDPNDPHVTRLDAAIEKQINGLMGALQRLAKGQIERLEHGYDPLCGEHPPIRMSVLSDRLRAEAIQKLEVAETLLRPSPASVPQRYSAGPRPETAVPTQTHARHMSAWPRGQPPFPNFRYEGANVSAHEGGLGGGRPPTLRTGQQPAWPVVDPYGRRVAQGAVSHGNVGRLQIQDPSPLDYRQIMERAKQPATAAQASLDPALRVSHWVDGQTARAIALRQGPHVRMRGGPSP